MKQYQRERVQVKKGIKVVCAPLNGVLKLFILNLYPDIIIRLRYSECRAVHEVRFPNKNDKRVTHVYASC